MIWWFLELVLYIYKDNPTQCKFHRPRGVMVYRVVDVENNLAFYSIL